jgi:predicted PurR-regulated permease PerM
MENNRINSSRDIIKILTAIVLVTVILYFGRTLLVPLSFAMLISFVLYPMCNWLEKKGINIFFSIGISLLAVFIPIGAIATLLIYQALLFSQDWPLLKDKIYDMIEVFRIYLENEWKISRLIQDNWLDTLMENSYSYIFPFLKQVLSGSAVSLVLLVLIPFYVAMFLYYRKLIVKALFALFPEAKQGDILSVIKESITAYYSFIKGMALVYLIVAILNSIGLALLGIPHPVLFGIIASLLTFIPYVGITIGAILPMSIAWITYDSWTYPIGVILVFTVVQYLEANIIFPLAVSSRMNINTLFTIIAIIAGGVIWGAAGMILFVPFIAILKLVSERVDSLQSLAILLGNDAMMDKKKSKK